MSMRDNLKPAIEHGADKVSALIRSETDKIIDAICEAYRDHEGEKDFTFKVNTCLSLTPHGDTTRVGASISWSVRYKAESEDEEYDPNQPELFDDAEDDQRRQALAIADDMGDVGVSDLQRQMGITFARADGLLQALTKTGEVKYTEAGKYRRIG